MSLEYDFDIVAVAPEAIDPEHGTIPATGHRHLRARFRDIRTADALRAASPKIRSVFLESGFCLQSADGGLARGYYRPEDATERNLILARLFANIRSKGVQGEYRGEFDFHDFLAHVRNAKPANTDRAMPARPLRRPGPISAPPARRSATGRIGFALGIAVVLFVLLKLLAAHGAAL